MNKSVFSKPLWVFFVVLSVYVCMSIVWSFLPRLPRDFKMHGDFHYRYNEIKCCQSGVNPYRIWSEEEASDIYCSLKNPVPEKSIVHVYPPWEYTFLSPLTAFPLKTAECIFFAMNFLGVVLIATVAFHLGYRPHRNIWHGCFVAACSMATARALYSAQMTQNFGILIAASLMLMILALNKHHDVLAGICWAFMMVKPQLGTLFIIPLLVKKKYTTIAVAVLTCLLASIPPAVWSNTSPIDLILHFIQAGDSGVYGTTLFPHSILSSLVPYVSIWFFIVISVFITVPLCVILTRKLRNASWHLAMCPAVVSSVVWTVSRDHDYMIYALVFMCVGVSVVETRKLRGNLLGLCLILTSLGSTFIIRFIKILSHFAYPACPLPDQFLDRTRAFSYIALFIIAAIWLWRVAKTRDNVLYNLK
jgi:Protein of unknown function (DUF2029).